MRNLMLAACASAALATSVAAADPRLVSLTVPPPGPGGEATFPIEGKVDGDPSDLSVVVFAKNRDGVEFIQPWANAYRTSIDPNSHAFKTVTHPGLVYTFVLLRGGGFTSAATRSDLPKLGGDVIDMVSVRPSR
jgi:hypothetical protein